MAGKKLLIPRLDPGTLQMQVEEQPLEPQTWTSDVLVPLTQNLCGGLAVGGLGFIAFVAVHEWRTIPWKSADVLLWCLLAGGAVTCAMTILRFFSDDLGITVQAYHAGQRSMLPRISALETQLQAAQEALAGKHQHTSAEARLLEVMSRARTDAERLIRLYFEGDKIDRLSMAGRGMGQRDWERARRLLQAAGVIDGSGRFIVATPAAALKHVHDRFTTDARRKGSQSSFTPAWQ
jgi:hypothetical protein